MSEGESGGWPRLKFGAAGGWGVRGMATGSEGNGAVSLRRRRMEIRRIKMMASGSAYAEQPVSKRLRPVGGVYAPRGDEADASGGCGESACEKPNRNRGALCGPGFDRGCERGQQDGSTCARNGMSVCGVVPDPDGQAAPSSLSAAWERPSGGVCGLGEGNECANNSSAIVGNHSSDRMSSGEGSNSSGQRMTEESDVSSSLTFVGVFQSALGNDTVAVQQPLQALAAGPRSSEARQPSQAVTAGVHSSGANQSSQTVGAEPRIPEEQVSSQTLAHNSGTEDMATSTASETLTTGCVDDQTLKTSRVSPQDTPPWEVSGNESTMANTLSAVAAADAGGSSVPSNCFSSNECPPHGMVSLCGRRREMEDAVVSKDSFVTLPCSKAGGCEAEGSEDTPLHYFGVYDGHGGSQAANFCAERLHQALAEEVESCFVDQNSVDWESKWLTAMTQCFKRMDAEVGGFCLEEGECQANENARCCPEPIAPETVGTTAIIAVVGACQIIVGNCGDSRAVLSRGGVAIPLSVDHKPEREDEMARVEAAGGRVIYWNGYRVLGVLAMSRAIGDRYLKPYVIAEPEVKCVKRAEDDECLILASDGLWDVMSNEVVCDIARRALNCKRNGQPPDASLSSSSDEESPAAQAAALLVKLALAKGSSDNISVVVVDLKVSRNR